MISMRTKLHVGAVELLVVMVGVIVLGVALVAHGQTPPSPARTVIAAKAPAKAPVAVKAPASAPVAAPLPAPLPAAAPLPPASQPTIKVPVGVGPWLQANASWFIPLLIFVLSTLATVLSKYPRAKGLVAALRMFLGGLSMLEFKDGKRPGMVLKWPATLPAPPPDEAPKG